MTFDVRLMESRDAREWDEYVHQHPHANLYHMWGWKEVIEKSYGHKGYYLVAIRKHGLVGGVLPLFHFKSPFFGNSLVSLPFFDLGGILADDEDMEKRLMRKAVELAQDLRANSIELRHSSPLSILRSRAFNAHGESRASDEGIRPQSWDPDQETVCLTRSHKVRMLLDIPESPDELMQSFKSKLRSQIRKPMKESLESKIGGLELIDDFYRIFSVNMRDLGSPVHSKSLIAHVVRTFGESARIFIVYRDAKALACSLTVGFKKTLGNPWASALKDYARLSPNMLLYWTMMEYACTHGFRCFDFGRSSPDEGTYKFKEQWGAKGDPVHWHYILLNGKKFDANSLGTKKYQKAIQWWSKLPLPAANAIGPLIRKHISL